MCTTNNIQLLTKDDQILSAEVEVLRGCQYFGHIIWHMDLRQPILVHVHSTIMLKILNFLNHYRYEPQPTPSDLMRDWLDNKMCEWDVAFTAVEKSVLRDLWDAGSQFGVNRLKHVVCMRAKLEKEGLLPECLAQSSEPPHKRVRREEQNVIENDDQRKRKPAVPPSASSGSDVNPFDAFHIGDANNEGQNMEVDA